MSPTASTTIPHACVNLTERGRAQAEAASNDLRTVRFTHAYASEFPRAQQTAAILLRHHACPLHIDARLNERRSGMDGLPVQAFNDLVRPDPLRIKPQQGESFLELMERLRSFLDEIAMRHADGMILAVSHENPDPRGAGLDRQEMQNRSSRGSIANCARVELDWPQSVGWRVRHEPQRLATSHMLGFALPGPACKIHLMADRGEVSNSQTTS